MGKKPRKQNPIIKVNPQLYRRLKMVTSWRDQTIAEYLDQRLGPILAKDFQAMQQEMKEEET